MSKKETVDAPKAPSSLLKNALLLLFCIGGIYSAYLTQGLLSEKLATRKYGTEKEGFSSHLEVLNWAQSVCCCIWAWLILQALILAGAVKSNETALWHEYWLPGVTNSIGPALGLISLKNITYSAQVLVKSCKMVPVMLAGFLLHGTRYSLTEYVCMTLIGVGVALFGSKSSSHVAKKLAKPNTPLGYSLCLINIAFDGYTNAAQDHINKKHPKSPPIHMMCYINFWTSIYLSVYLFGFTSQGMSMISFCIKHPEALWDVILFCLCGAFGQLFIFFTIKTFGSLINTLICTTRKFVNILVSVIIHANPLLPMQWVAVSMVFLGLIVSSLSKTKSHHKKKKAD